ncbi:NAD(P)H-dependent glycerol-3-phosphate dehydrogenase [Magnetococcales bacterium HHB-1]
MTTAQTDSSSVAVIGAGSWGTALAHVLASKQKHLSLWCREAEVAEGINQDHKNPLYVSEFNLSPNIYGETDLKKVVLEHRILVMVIPTQFTSAILQQIKPHLQPGTTLVYASKGIEVKTFSLISTIHDAQIGSAFPACFLSGPSFARDVLSNRPTAVSIAGQNESITQHIQDLFHTPHFRTYTSTDVVGVELGGALKNVIAIAAGICDGLEFGHSARAALITRGLAEIIRLGVHFGGEPQTFAGLSGMGDLLLTATSDLSRNRVVGYRIGCGERLQDILSGTKEVAEGVKTVEAVCGLSEKHAIEMPISQAVFDILYKNRKPRSVVTELMNRSLRPETE